MKHSNKKTKSTRRGAKKKDDDKSNGATAKTIAEDNNFDILNRFIN